MQRVFVEYEAKGSGQTKVCKELFEIPERYTISQLLGTGSYGVVARATDKVTGEDVAIKKFKNMFAHPRLALCAAREVLLLSHMHEHENIVELIDVLIPSSSMETFEEVYCVLKYYPLTLETLVQDKSVDLSTDVRAFLIYQLLCGMKALHSAGVAHRDLKPNNVLVNEDFALAVCDFGSGRAADQREYIVTFVNGCVTTQWYVAPEGVLQHLNPEDRSVDESHMFWKTSLEQLFAGDMWSVGCILAEIMLRRPLFNATHGEYSQLTKIFDVMGTPSKEVIATQAETVRRILEQEKPRDDTIFTVAFQEFPVAEVHFLKSLLQFRPEDRLTIDEAL
eukprot:PhF_6_TR35985/c0_g1_i2/m.52101/K04441/P38; p38 MAP kinase